MLSMLIFAAASAAQPQIEVPQTAKSTNPATCRDGIDFANLRPNSAPVRAQKLNELPNANEYIAVWRGCDKPLIVRYDIGSAPAKQR